VSVEGRGASRYETAGLKMGRHRGRLDAGSVSELATSTRGGRGSYTHARCRKEVGYDAKDHLGPSLEGREKGWEKLNLTLREIKGGVQQWVERRGKNK